MKAASPKKTRLAEVKRPFTWGIKSSEIGFTTANDAERAIDGSGNDCSAITPLDKPRKKKPVKGA